MTVTMIHIYHADNNPGEIGVQVHMPLNDIKYCIQILQTLDKVRADVVKILANKNQEDMSKKTNFFQFMKQKFGMSMSEQDKKNLENDIQKLQDAEKVGTGIQTTMTELAKALNKADSQEQQRIIKDVNASIQNIVGGG